MRDVGALMMIHKNKTTNKPPKRYIMIQNGGFNVANSYQNTKFAKIYFKNYPLSAYTLQEFLSS